MSIGVVNKKPTPLPRKPSKSRAANTPFISMGSQIAMGKRLN